MLSLLAIANRLNEVYPNMDIDTLRGLIGVAIAGEIAISDLGHNFGWPKSKASQRGYQLTTGRSTDSQKIAGLGLCMVSTDPRDDRYKLLSLSPAGRKLIEQMASLIKE